VSRRSCTTRIAALAALAALVPAPAAAAPGSLLGAVDPLVGTDEDAPDFGTGGGSGATFPGAMVPFGMVQPSPDTVPSEANYAGGYSFRDRRIRGFSLTHFSGAGCTGFRDVPLVPTAAPVTVAPPVRGSSDLQPRYVARFSHRRERAAPGDYRVVLDPGTRAAIATEVTATPRVAAFRLRFPRTASASVLLNAGGSAMANGHAAVALDPRRREISGTAEGGGFCYQPGRYRVFFVVRFGRPFAASGAWQEQALRPGARRASDRSDGPPSSYAPAPGAPRSLPGNPSTTAQAGAYATFDARRRRTVEARVALSFVSVAAARRNLAAEAPARRRFGALRGAARARWARLLGRVRVRGGRRADRTSLATALYHALLHPSTFSDADGRYRGMDGRVHRARGFTKLANVSGWDVYRSQVPLLALLAPGRGDDLAASLVADARESGCLPRWPYANVQTNVMVGDPSVPVLAGLDALGTGRRTARAALRAMRRGATRPCRTANGDYTQREGLEGYLRRGWVPHDLNVDVTAHTFTARDRPWGSAATTLEYALADFALSRMAARHGDRAGAARFRRQAGAWRALVDPSTRTIRPRRADGSFVPVPPDGDEGFVEGSAAQYGWLVPHDPAGLAAALGGRRAAADRLERHLARLNAGPRSAFAFLGNEPGLGAPWLLNRLGRPWRTQAVVRRALLELYRPSPGGMPGNDDGGTLSAWWVFGALGLYPAVPGDDLLAIGSPLFRRVTLRLPRVGTVRIAAPRAARSRPYVHGLRLDGRAVRRPWLRATRLRDGATLRFDLGARPDRRWGAARSAAPPSSRPAEPAAAAQAANSVRSGSRSPRRTARSTSTHASPRASASTRACGLTCWAASTPRQSAIAGSQRIRSR
jgi:predicted alpha-1,2-mannosidase